MAMNHLFREDACPAVGKIMLMRVDGDDDGLTKKNLMLWHKQNHEIMIKFKEMHMAIRVFVNSRLASYTRLVGLLGVALPQYTNTNKILIMIGRSDYLKKM